MKLPPPLLARLATTFAALGAGAAFAELPATPLRESEQRQEQIQGETRGIADTLDAMLGEYERNNLAGDAAAAVRRIRESLGSLSGTEMRQVVDMLQRARVATNADAAVTTVADAFTAQKQIIVAIQRILAEHLRAQEAAEISRQLHELADRQALNFRNGIDLARMTNGGQSDDSGALEHAQLETQRGEQAAIAEEMKMIRGKISRLAANPENASTAETFRAAAKQIEQTEPLATAAADSLKAGQLFKAATDEKANRDELRKIARQIAPREQGTEALRKAERELAEVIAEQRRVHDSTSQQRKQADLDKWLAEKLAANDRNDALPQRLRNQPASELRANPEIRSRFEAEQLDKDTQLATLEDQQGELAGKTDALAQKLAEVPQAAAGLKGAMEKMQEARAAMQEADVPHAAQQQDAAIAQLAAAQAELKRRADESEARAAAQMAQTAPAQPDNPADAAKMAAAMTQLAEAQQQIEKAQANLQQAAEQSGRQLAQDAAQAAQQAAQAAQQAAEAAEAAQKQAARAENPKAAQQAGEAAQQAAQAAQAAQQAAKNAQQMAANPGQQAAAAQQAAKQAGQAAQAAQQAAQAAQNSQQAATQAAQQAAQAGQAAAQNANQQAAQQAGQAAQSAQHAARSAQQAQQMAQAAANSADNAAQQAIASSSMQKAAQQLAQASKAAAQAASQSGSRTSPTAQEAMQQAGQQLSAAASQATSGQNSAAQQSAQGASQSLAQAQAMMAAQQAGLSPSQGGAPEPGAQGQGQKGQGSQPGQGQGPGKNSQASNQPSQGAETYIPGDPQAMQRGARDAALKQADFIGLPPRERAAIQQSLREKYPQEYGVLVEQYLLNLANESAKK